MELLKNRINIQNYHILKAMGFEDKEKIQLVFNKGTKSYLGRVDDEYKIILDSFIENNESVSKSELELLKKKGLSFRHVTILKSNNIGNRKSITYYILKSELEIIRGKKNVKTKD